MQISIAYKFSPNPRCRDAVVSRQILIRMVVVLPAIYCAHSEMVEIGKLVPFPRNPNKHPDKQIEMLAKIINAQGWRAPITVSKRSGYIIRGHGRLMAAQRLGLEQVPVDYQDYANEAEEYADLIADNRIAELSELDDELVRDLLAEIDDAELAGFTQQEYDDLFRYGNDIKEDDFDVAAVVDAIETPTAKRGNVFKLGRHRLMCGDATNKADVQRLIGGAKADMIFTDPPYNVNYEGGTGLKIKNDNMAADEFSMFLCDAFSRMFEVAVNGAAIYICHADSSGNAFRNAMLDSGWLMKQCLIWVKNQFVLGRQDYQWRHEPILYGWKPGAKHKWFGGRKQSTVIDNDSPCVITEQDGKHIITFDAGFNRLTLAVSDYEILDAGGDDSTSVWRIDKPQKSTEHPTMKPLALCARAIRNSSATGDIVLDPFGGSGSTLIAAEQTGRICYMMELDAVYVDVICQRYEAMTGIKAELMTSD